MLALERKRLRDFPKLLSLKYFNPAKSIFRAVRLLVVMFLVLFVLANVMNSFGFLDSRKVLDFILAQTPLTLFIAAAVAPIGEELFFRGYLQKRVGVVFASVLFAALHFGYGSVVEVVAAFLISILLGFELRKNNDLHACILAHAGYNMITIILALHYAQLFA
jgi:membrane protease YdiL (CAAX protease family)